MSMKRKIAFVTPWFGENIPGGAEMETRGITTHLNKSGIEVEILTTCVKEFSSDWNENYYKEGVSFELGMNIRRFKVRKRNTKEFDRVNYKLMKNLPIEKFDEDVYFKEMINSSDLYKYIDLNKERYDLFVFIPYMFGTTYYGCQICPEKSVVIPCLHDESYAYMESLKNVFSKVSGMIFHSKPELDLAKSIYDLSYCKAENLGEGVDTETIFNKELFAKKYNIEGPFILYAGRKDKGKNVDLLVNYFNEYKKKNDNELKLVFIGGGDINIPESIGKSVFDLGFISKEDKYNAYASATLLCQPSNNESFSLVIMESWLCKRPVLVSGRCEVTKNFSIESNGGLYFDNYFEFEKSVNYIVSNPKIADRMGLNGRRYVLDNFAWDVIVKKYTDFFEAIILKNEIKSDENRIKNSKDDLDANSEAYCFKDNKKSKIALVNQRYGLEVNGGSELHCRQLAEKLKEHGYEVEVITTCALDYITWENHYKEGISDINGIKVRRFKNLKERDIKKFNNLSEIILNNKDHTIEESVNWIKEQGPYCPDLIEYIKENNKEYKKIIFMTYLYFPTAFGIALELDNAILLPTAHDEPPIYLKYYETVFNKPNAIIYNTSEEKEFIIKKFHNEGIPSIVAGVGIDLPDLKQLPDIKKMTDSEEYLVYVGRIDESKGCGTLFEYFKEYKERNKNNLKLILVGKAVMDIPKTEDIISLGFVEEKEKFAILKNAKALVLASEFESLSMVVLESLIMGIPVIVNGKCNVLKGHCFKSNAGLYFENYFEFEKSVNFLKNNESVYKEMGQNGVKYVEENYDWEIILGKIIKLIER